MLMHSIRKLVLKVKSSRRFVPLLQRVRENPNPWIGPQDNMTKATKLYNQVNGDRGQFMKRAESFLSHHGAQVYFKAVRAAIEQERKQ